MELKYTVHLDDYHSNITAFGVRSTRIALGQVQGEIANGYDVTNITLDGQPFDVVRAFCPRLLADGEPCPNRIDRDGVCIVHDHQARYEADEYSYKGD